MCYSICMKLSFCTKANICLLFLSPLYIFLENINFKLEKPLVFLLQKKVCGKSSCMTYLGPASLLTEFRQRRRIQKLSQPTCIEKHLWWEWHMWWPQGLLNVVILWVDRIHCFVGFRCVWLMTLLQSSLWRKA